ncbi:hypothetical protein EX895_003696 [Sporisorium graminicola]|uniref:AAA+ ATPase domain-containing protein n=1 Tax=Sporisorium graminicola TaxID=280036 RepID=A0A4V6ETK6_9BASI|nr:hypothetical protein EX895_003696 [Sporisorium graminicola]TKY87019.1 hypothetical protein EX895_003696 [Sporisorium graminicola]
MKSQKHSQPPSSQPYTTRANDKVMRQATLPWAAPPLPSSRPEHHHPLSHLADHIEQPAEFDSILPDLDAPPCQTSTPPLLYELDPSLQLDPALFSSSQDAAAIGAGQPAVDILAPGSGPPHKPDLTASPSSSSATSGVTLSAGLVASTQQTQLSSAPETDTVLPAEPAETAPDPSLTAVTSVPTSAQPETKSLPHLHPFFRPGGTSNHSTDSNDESDTENRRPARSSRTKAPVSYREDLKAVLRADAAKESARLKEEKRKAKLEASAAKRALKSVKVKPSQPGSTVNSDADDFELLETRVATSTGSNASKAHQPSGEAAAAQSSSSSKPQQSPKHVEPKPLSLAVKGTGAAAAANPHPFFTKKPKQQPLPPIDVDTDSSQGGDNNEAPSSYSIDPKGKAPATTKSTSASDSSPASWSLFSTHRVSSSKPKKPLYAPWPTLQDTHVVGLLETENELLSRAQINLAAFRSCWQPGPSSSTIKHSGPAPPPDFVSRMNRTRPRPHLDSISLLGSDVFGSRDDFLAQVDASNLSPQACTSVAQQAESCRTSGQLWTDAFRPHLASACLGNETNAGYLRDWLRRLLVAAPGSVRTTDSKRKHAVQRRVDRRRKKRVRRGYSDDDDDDSDDMADFIVDDDDEEEEDEDAEGEYDESIVNEGWFSKFAKIDRSTTVTDEGESVDVESSQGTAIAESTPQEATSQQNPSQRHRFASLDRLTNCMLLTGPSGSGKTASVYACAAELGYEVFELYPGMGKRSGKELLAAVGDLGRNHMVSSGGIGGGATFKKPPQQSSASPAAAGSAVGPTTTTTTTVRQSLILIEEADVLFEEDKGFWAAVVELVAESKRPVVVVCNDLELLPVHDLPVQHVLEYTNPRVSDQLVPWLQTVAAHMGRLVNSDQVQTMLRHLPSTTHALDTGDPTHADLRQALHQLQFGHLACTAPRHEQQRDWLQTLAPAAGTADMKALARAAESRSVADVLESALNSGNTAAEMDAFGDAGVDTSRSSRQWGAWVQLVPSPLASQQQRQAVVGIAEGMGAHLEYQSTLGEMHASLVGLGSIEDHDSGVEADRRMKRLQDRQAARLHTLIQPLLTPLRHSSSRLPPSLVTDYAPMIRLMALVDEDLAQIHASLRLQQQQQQQQQQVESSSSAQEAPAVAGMARGRSTRTSRAAAFTSWLTGTPEYGYERWLGAMGPEQVAVAQSTRLTF